MTQLPEPSFIERDAEQITKAWIDLYESKTGKVLQPAQIERLMIDIGAYRENLLRINIQNIAKQNLLSYADLEMLKHIGEPLDVTQLLASSAVTILKFSVDESLDFDFIIPKGTEVETKDGLYIFQTIENVVLQANSLYVTANAICETSGKGANGYIIGSINNLISPLSYISNVENTVISSAGSDEEDAESLRERIRQAPEKFSNAGSKGAYIYHTLSAHSSITDVSVSSPSPGVVNIYPLLDTGNPDSTVINKIQTYLSNDKIKPLTDLVQVISPSKVEFQISATLTLYTDADEGSVLAAVESELNKYKKNLAKKLGKDVICTQIISILNSIYGVFKVDLTAPQTDSEIEDNEWADLTEWTILIGGYADE